MLMILPLSLLAALGCALVLRGVARTAGFAAVLVVLFLSSWWPVVWVGAWTLEGRYVASMPPTIEPPDAMVVLSGYMRKNVLEGPPTAGLDTYERLTYAAALHKHWKDTPIIVTGGRLLGDDLPAVSHIMAQFLIERGVPRALVEEEGEAANTYENAVFTAKLLGARGLRSVALVTHATHMLRAELAFSRQGLDVFPAPCCFATHIDEWTWRKLVPSWYRLETMESVFHEWLGIIAYRVRGWI